MLNHGLAEEMIYLMDKNFNEIMRKIGWFGKFTIRTYAIMYLSIIVGAMNIGGAVFLAAKVSYECEVESVVKDYVTETCHYNWTENAVKLSRPMDENKTSQCELYSSAELVKSDCSYWQSDQLKSTNFTTKKCSVWNYNRTTFVSTIITDFNLVCDNKWKQNISQLMLMLGILIGAVFSGIGSDRWGRRVCFLISLMVLLVFSFLTSFIKHFWLFAFIRSMVGFGSIGLCISGVVYAMEITSVSDRVWVSQTLQASFAFAFMLLAFLGYLERRWIVLNLVISAPLIVLLPLYAWFSAESPRWLLSKNKPFKAFQTLKKMASVNGKSIDEIFELLKRDKAPILKNRGKPDSEAEVVVSREKYSTAHLFCNVTLRNISLVLYYNWFAVTCIYYGLTLNTASLNGNVFMNFFLAALVEIPANFGAIFVIKWWGRRPVICLCNIICGISLLSMMFVPDSLPAVNITLFLIGKFGATATFSCIYLYSSELYPTPLRGNGLGACSGWARLGGVVSQLIIMLSHINQNLPFVVFGIIAAVAGFLVVLLPETRGLPLPETVADTERIYKNRDVTLFKQFVPKALRRCC